MYDHYDQLVTQQPFIRCVLLSAVFAADQVAVLHPTGSSIVQ